MTSLYKSLALNVKTLGFGSLKYFNKPTIWPLNARSKKLSIRRYFHNSYNVKNKITKFRENPCFSERII